MQEGTQSAPIDRYVVLEYLAEGGMGAIYLGKKLGAGGFEKQVVLKQLLPEFTRQPEFIDLFLREARLSATLDHANITHTIDLVTAGDEHFIVMEYVDGADLRTLLKRAKRSHGRFSPAAGIYVAREVLSALAYAHNKVGPDGKHLELIHRDISPSNVLISKSGEVKLTDFGIAKAATHNSVFYRVKGKIGYMSPEQARSETLDARSDLYSLSVCLYEIITGERLFVVGGLTTSADEMYSQPVPLLSQKVPGLSPELDQVMQRALAVDPDERFQTAGEYQEALLRCAHRNGLMMSAPELSDHLTEVCGPTRRWREGDTRGESGGGTELYDQEEGTEQLDPSELSSSGADYDVVAIGGQFVNAQQRRRMRQKTSLTHLGELQGVELTSLINLSGGDPNEGAQPLAEFERFEQLAESARPVHVGSIADRLPRSDSEEESPPPRASRLRDETNLSGEVVRPAPAPRPRPRPAQEAPPAERSSRGPWLIVSLILLLGIATAAVVGLSGPTLDRSGPAPKPQAPESPAAAPDQ